MFAAMMTKGEMSMILLEKVEELTLYLIEVNRRNEKLDIEVEELTVYLIEKDKEIAQIKHVIEEIKSK